MFATCSWPSLCEQSELQCWRRNRRLCGPVQISVARALPLIFDISILNTLPVRAKVKINRSPILLPLQGVGVYVLIPRALPWARDLLGFQPVLGRRNIRPPHFASKVSYSASPQVFAACSRNAYSFRVPLWGGWAAACGCCARDKLFVLWMLAFFVVDALGLTKGQKKWDTSVSRPC